jgi:FlaA1/EpsC-like NDP-sugar epimerase
MIRLAGFVPYKDIQIKEIGLRPGEKLYEELHLNKEDVHTTPNKLIFVAKPMKISDEVIRKELSLLSDVIEKPDVTDQEVIDVLCQVVDTYKPNRKGDMEDVQDAEAMV